MAVIAAARGHEHAASLTTLTLRTTFVRSGSVAVLGLADFQASMQGTSEITDEAFAQLLTG